MVRRLIQKYPVVKTMGAYFCLNSVADISEQFLIKKRTLAEYDKAKTLRIAATGGLVIGPMLYNWIRFLHRYVPGKTLLLVLKKVVIDSACFAPVAISSFYITTNILEGKTDLTAEWKQKFLTTWTTGFCYWPVVQTINFAFIPLQYKTSLYMPTASFIWVNYLCFMKDKKVTKEENHVDAASRRSTSPPSSSSSSSSLIPASGVEERAEHSTADIKQDTTTAVKLRITRDVETINVPANVTPRSSEVGERREGCRSRSVADSRSDIATETSSKTKSVDVEAMKLDVKQGSDMKDKPVSSTEDSDKVDKRIKIQAMKVTCES